MNKKINKTCLVALSVILAATTGFASPLTPEQALKRMESNSGMSKMPVAKMSETKLVHTVSNPEGEAAVYVFNRPGGGFVVLSADDTAYPVLGYSETGTFDVASVPPQLTEWLSGYATQIEKARTIGENKVPVLQKAVAKGPLSDAGYAKIEPLLKTKWNQDEPYNLMCPEFAYVNNKFNNAYSGCVATSMAQVMNYFEYPPVGFGGITYTPPTMSQTLSMNFGEREFDWDNMLNEYKAGAYSQVEGEAVAYLMKACGYSVEMQYGPYESSAMSSKIASALINNFRYDAGARYVPRRIYSDEEWAKIIYDNLANVGPVIYDGTAPFVGGHSFVCDGYDGKGYFHFNWGWGGMSDGYFSLEALNPTSVGIGGFAGGFNVDQDAVIGIRKPDGEDHKVQLNVIQEGTVVGSLENGNTIRFGADGMVKDIFNYNSETITLNIGGIFENTNGTASPVYSEGKMGSKSSITMKSFAYYNYTNYDYPSVPIPEGLADGTYKVYYATMQQGFENAQWLPINVRYGMTNYVMLTVANGEYTVENVSPVEIVINNAWFDSDLVYGRTSMFHISITNNSDVDITRPYYPVFSLNDDIMMMGDTRMLTIPAHETLETQWEIGLTRLQAGFFIDKAYSMLLWVADADAGIVLSSFGIVKIYPAPTFVSFQVKNFTFEGDDMKTGIVNVDGEKKEAYLFQDMDNMTVRITATPSAYFNGDLYITAAGAGSSELSTGIDEVFRKQYEIYKDVQLNTRVSVSYPSPEEGQVYSFKLYSDVNNTQTLLAEAFVALQGSEEGGVESLEAYGNGEVRYYNLTGVQVTPKPGDIVIRVVPGKKPVKVIYTTPVE